ncbi:MAG: hypothetical protein ITG05_05000 [Pseudomonas stutzeri]|nr:hypothetical protein [Stutzerimonas stutzeri]
MQRVYRFGAWAAPLVALLFCMPAQAATYTLNGVDRPALCNGNMGSWSGNTYICSWGQPFRVGNGDDVLTTLPQIKILSYSGFNLINSTIGGVGRFIDLEAQGSNFTKLNGSTLYGSIVGQSNNVDLLAGTMVNGSVSVTGTFKSDASTITGNVSANNGIDAVNTVFQGGLTATSALIKLEGGSVAGLVKTDCCTITTSGTVLSAGAQANSGITIEGGVIAGSLVIASQNGTLVNNNIAIKDAVMISGDINAFNVQISNSQIGSSQESIEVIARGNYLDLTDNTVVYGHVEVANTYGEITIEPGSRVIGTCLADTTRNPSVNNNVNGECGGAGDDTVHHYELNYSVQALTCGSLSVAIRACADAACSSTLSNPSTLTLSPSGGWASNPITFTGNTTATLVVRSPGEITLGVGSASPAASNGLMCSTSGCKVRFHDSGFLVDVPDFISGDSVSMTIQAVKADEDDPQKCSPAFDSGTRTLSFWSSYEDPNEEVQVGNQSVSIDGATIGKTSETATPIDITFSQNATARLSSLTYPDAGKMALHVSYSGAGNEEGLSMETMEGQGGFIVTPAQLKVEARTIEGQPVICSDPEGDFDTDDCRAFVAAGDDFSLHVTALNRVGNVTANFRYEKMIVEVVPTDIHPGGGVAVLSPAKYVHGLNNVNTFPSEPKVDEVGVVKIRATAEHYLKDNNQVVGTSDWVGRFFPAWLELGEKPKQNIGCLPPPSETAEEPGFTYQGQPTFLTDKLEVRGFNRSGVPTQNYKGAFWRFTGTLEPAEREGATIYELHQNSAIPVAGHPSAIADRVTPPPVFEATPAEAAFLPSGGYSFSRPATPSALDNFFSLNMVMWNWHDMDGVYFKRDDDQPKDERGFEPTVPMPVVAPIGDSHFLLGRVRSENLIVPHGNSAQAPIVLEHWNGAAWQLDVDNDCTLLAPPTAVSAERVIFPDSGLPDARVDEAEEWNQSYLQITDATGSEPKSEPQGSVWLHHLLRHSNGVSATWLCQRSEGNASLGGVCSYQEGGDAETRSSITFGIYQGPKPLIFRRELYRGMQ